MSNIISLFPTYDKELQLFSFSEYSFSYLMDGKEISLSQKSDKIGVSTEVVLDDETGNWTPTDNELRVSRDISINNACQLYFTKSDASNSENAIACHNATIGLGVLWSSSLSYQRGAVIVGEIKRTDEEQKLHLSMVFPKSSLRGELHLSIVLFLMNPGAPSEDEKIYANEPGFKLGEIDSFFIQVDGNGSFFPIREEDKPGEPLWRIECNWTNPEEDLLEDCVAIILNKGHKNYKELDRNDKKFNIQLLYEVFGNAVGIMIETLRQDDNFDSLKNAQEGSVASAVNYFTDKLNWDITSPLSTSLSIRRTIEAKRSE